MSNLRHKLANLGGSKGFTLVELLVVVAVIGLLALIAIPTFLSQTDKAKNADAQSTIKNVAETVSTLKSSSSGQFDDTGSDTSANLVTSLQAGEPAYTYTAGTGANLQASTGPKGVVVLRTDATHVVLQAKSSSGTYYCDQVVADGVDVKGRDAAADDTACPGTGTAGW